MENIKIKNTSVSVFRMIRAPFLSSIFAPLIAGSILAYNISGEFYFINFILVLLTGAGLHIATNVYNDIYDTIQGTDKINVNRNEFSGGSGILSDNPEMFPKMYFLARLGLLVSLAATISLTFFIKNEFVILLWILVIVSAFLSKYYTAPPVKLAYRGLGEFFVFFAFGPMATSIAVISQNVPLSDPVFAVMPMTGISTLSILLIGQMIDVDADKATGKLGMAGRAGNKSVVYFYLFIKILMILNIIVAALLFVKNGLPLLLCLIPYILHLPKIIKLIYNGYNNPDNLKIAAKINVLIHLIFSALLIMSLLISSMFVIEI